MDEMEAELKAFEKAQDAEIKPGKMDWRKRRRLHRKTKEARRKARRELGTKKKPKLGYRYPLKSEIERAKKQEAPF